MVACILLQNEQNDRANHLFEQKAVKWAATDVTAVDYLRTRINPAKASCITGKLGFVIDGVESQLEIRNRIAEFSNEISEDAILLEISGEDFGKYYTGELKAKDLAGGEALKLLSIFDEYQPVTMFPRRFDHLK